MTPATNADRLRALMKKHGLTRPAVAEKLGVSRATVNTWLAPPGASSHVPMPGHRLELLEIKLKQ